ncbi:F-box domain protein [Dictyocaulus viviparus]|uniref:F-box domain protein n=1 Tax=Dictyocaulus viviparus TaxID=29172 RepID=A0A0D8XGS3_DICVI|nr:F-box domain protein [Dictyocaulus viviparus]
MFDVEITRSILSKSFQLNHRTSKRTTRVKIMPLHLIRRLSFRHRKHHENIEKEEKPRLTDDLVLRVVDQCDVIEQIRLRAVCTTIKNHVDRQIKKITHLSVEKRDIDTITGSGWSHHPHAQVAIKMHLNHAKIVVDSKWTSRDVSTVVAAMSVYRKTILEAVIDAPIAELMVVSLSALDLNRWYAFQCYMKALDVFDEDMHLDCDFVNRGEVYWPNIQNLTIRTTEQQAPHLARIIDYGVKCNCVLDRRNLCRLRIIFTDLNAIPSRKVSKHLYHFRCWAGSAGFDHRYEQQFASSKAQSVMI